MDLTYGERSKDEPRRVSGEGSRDIKSNYLFCPTLCRTCKFFSESNSNYPYMCNVAISDSRANASKKEGYKQYDDCRYYKELERDEIRTITAFDNKFSDDTEDEPTEKKSRWELMEEERERKEEEAERRFQEEQDEIERQMEFEDTHCYICAKEGFLVSFHGRKFHKPCLEEFKQSEDGKIWIKKQEAEEVAINERIRKRKEEKREKEEVEKNTRNGLNRRKVKNGLRNRNV
jgi:hypothetical protein